MAPPSILPSPPAISAMRESAGLSRERILQAAIGLIDEGGMDALNMRELGRVLGVSTMAVYRHFHNKSDLLDAVIDHVVALFEPSGVEGSWQEKAREICLRVRAGMLAHPELADLIGREFRRTPISFRINAQIIEILHDSGVPEALLAQTYWAVSSYTTGYALLEAQVRRRAGGPHGGGSRDGKVQKLSAMMRSVEGISACGLALAPPVLSLPLDEAQFLFGLECLLAGLQTQIGDRPASGGHSAA